MATSDILGLFMSPEEYQAQQMAQQQTADQARALGFAGLSPLQQANYGVFMGAQQLGRGFGGLLGVQDPQLQRIRQRQEIMQTINPADPQSLIAGIQRASEMNDPELALSLTDYMNKQGSEMALAAQRTAAANKERKTATATEKERDAIAYANTISDNPDSPQWKDAYKTRLDRLQLGKEGAEKKSAFAQQLEDAGYIPGSPAYVSMMDKFLTKELTSKEDKDQITSVGETVAGNKEGLPAGLKVYTNKTNKTQYVLRDGKEVPYYGAVEPPGKTTVEIKNVMPGQGKDGLTGIGKFRNEVGDSIKPFRATVNAADAALQNISDSIKSGNFSSFNAARVQLARALGDSTLSRRDIEQAGGDPSLIGGFFDTTSTLFTGTPSVDTQKKLQSTLKAIRSVARKKAQDELAVQRQLGLRAGYSEQDINMAFNFPEITGAGDGTNKPPPKKTVPFNALPK